MDAESFDRIAKTLSTAAGRRRALRFILSVPLAGSLAARLGETSEAGRRHERVLARNEQDDLREERREEKRELKEERREERREKRDERREDKVCTPESPAQTCAGRCGAVANNCGAVLDCGPCVCSPACPECQSCNTATGQCVPVTDGTACTTAVCCRGVCCEEGAVCGATGCCVPAGFVCSLTTPCCSGGCGFEGCT
jgi:hypothetical protein